VADLDVERMMVAGSVLEELGDRENRSTEVFEDYVFVLEELVLQSEGKPLMQGNERCREECVKKRKQIAFASRVIQDVHKNRVTREIKRQTM
jgi:hypothetical protein